MTKLKEAVYQEIGKVFTAFATWGLGVLLMIAYCSFVYWLNRIFNIYIVILGAILYLTISFFCIDLWWGYNKGKEVRE